MRLWEMEAFAAQPTRGAGKANPAVRRDEGGSPRFAIESDARANARHALDAARDRQSAAADLAERRDAQRAATAKAVRGPATASGTSTADIQARPGSTDTQKTSSKVAPTEAAERQRVGDRADARPDPAAPPTDEGDGRVDAEGEELTSLSESAAEREEAGETVTSAPFVPSTAAVGAPPAQVGATVPASGQTQPAGQDTGQPPSSAPQAVAVSAQAETAALPDAASGPQEAGARTDGGAGFQVHLDDIASPGATPGGLGPSASAGTDAVPASTATPHQGAPVPLGAVPMTIGLRSLAGSSHFEIRLDPVDLGRIDVRLDIDKDQGTVTTRVVVDRPETLALLQRDSGSLQQALTQAGLDPGSGISLSLRGDGMPGGQGSGEGRPDGRGAEGPGGSPASEASIPDDVAPRMLRGIAGIDIRI